MTKLLKWYVIIMVVLYSQICLGEEGKKLYNEGMNAYHKEDFVSAVKFLFAYQQMNQDKLDPEFNEALSRALHYSEQRLRSLIETEIFFEQSNNQQSIHSSVTMEQPPKEGMVLD